MREVVNGLMYVLSTGCQWRAIPKERAEKHGLRSIPVAIAYTLFLDRFISGITGGAMK